MEEFVGDILKIKNGQNDHKQYTEVAFSHGQFTAVKHHLSPPLA
jgi:hypothetical protein